jgi:hypothetical protein
MPYQSINIFTVMIKHDNQVTLLATTYLRANTTHVFIFTKFSQHFIFTKFSQHFVKIKTCVVFARK